MLRVEDSKVIISHNLRIIIIIMQLIYEKHDKKY